MAKQKCEWVKKIIIWIGHIDTIYNAQTHQYGMNETQTQKELGKTITEIENKTIAYCQEINKRTKLFVKRGKEIYNLP